MGWREELKVRSRRLERGTKGMQPQVRERTKRKEPYVRERNEA